MCKMKLRLRLTKESLQYMLLLIFYLGQVCVFLLLLFLGMVICANEVETKEKKSKNYPI